MMDTKNQKKNTKNHNFTNTAQISSSLPMMENDLDQICDHRKSLPNEKALSSPLPQNTMMSVEYEPNTEIICVDSTSAPPLSESFVEVWGENFSIEYVLRFFHELPAKKQEPLRIVSSQEIIDSMMTMQDLCCKCVTCLERVENKLHMTYDIFYQNLANGCLSRVATETLKLECAGNKSGMRAEDRAVRLAEVDLRDDQRHIVENAQELLEALRKIAVTNVSPPGEPTQLSQKIGEKPHKDLKNHILPEDITRMDDTIEDNEFLGTLRCETPFCGTSLTPEKEILPYDDIQCATHLECELEFERYLPNSEGKNWTELLAAMNLDSFADTFEAEGWDDIDLWPEMTDEDLLDLGFKKEDVFKWRTLYIVNEISDYESDFSEEDSDIRLTPTNCVLNLAPLTIQQVASKIVHDRIYSAYSENLAHQKQMALLLECEEEEAQKERRRQKRKQKRQKRRRKKKAKKNETN